MSNLREEISIFQSSSMISIKSIFAAVPLWLWLVQLVTVSITQMAFFVFITQYAGNPSISIEQVALGNALQAITFSTVFAICSIPGNEKHSGTLSFIMTTPTRIFSVIVGQSLFQIVTGMMTVGLSLGFAAAFFGVNFVSVNILAVVCVIAVTAYAMAGFGLMLSSLGMYLRSSTLLASLFLYVGLIFCGVNFPISQLPEYLQPISLALPLTYGVNALKASVAGSSVIDIFPNLAAMVVIGTIMIIAGYIMFGKFEAMARKTGALETF
jgi:ABC-2 type transport system permease protein